METRKGRNVLFLCAGNSCRSQMAEGFARSLAPDRIHAWSAGVEPKALDPRAVAVMREAGVDISGQRPKRVSELGDVRFDLVVTVCDAAKESCPVLPGVERLHISFEDPPALATGASSEEEALAHYRKVRDEIREFVGRLAEVFPPPPASATAAAPADTGPDKERLYRRANALALITIFYNVAEGLVSIFFGVKDETLSLFGFGADSFVEVLSGLGIWHMLRRIRAGGGAASPDRFERAALKVTGTSFYLLAAALAATAVADVVRGRAPETTFWGIVVSLVSIATMWALMGAKVRVGRALGSEAILADAACTKVCLLLSVVLLACSLGYALTGLGWLDSAGAFLIGWLAFREGREAFEKTRGGACSCGCS